MILSTIISSISLILVAIIGLFGSRKLGKVQTVQDRIEINTNHRMDEFLREIKALRDERDIRATDDLRKAKRKKDD